MGLCDANENTEPSFKRKTRYHVINTTNPGKESSQDSPEPYNVRFVFISKSK
jgi:hypothetical protein